MAPQTRIERRQLDRRLTRRRVIAAVVVLALLATLGVVLLTRGDDDKVGQASEPAPRTQRTLLMQLIDDNGLARASVVLGHDPANGRAVATFIPARVLTAAPGAGTVVFEQVNRVGGAGAARAAVIQLMGILVDDDWSLSARGMAGLVDLVGGVVVDVDVDVPGANGSFVVRAGPGQQLGGAAAAAYAMYLGPRENTLATAPRLQAVVDSLIDRIPQSAPLAMGLTRQGAASRSSMSPTALAGRLLQLRDARADDKMAYATLPVLIIQTGGQATYRADAPQVRALVEREFLSSIPPGRFAGRNRVILLNGVGTPGLAAKAQTLLLQQGYDIVRAGNADRFGYKTSVVYVRDSTPESLAAGGRVAALLRLPPGAVAVDPHPDAVSDMLVLLGADYRP